MDRRSVLSSISGLIIVSGGCIGRNDEPSTSRTITEANKQSPESSASTTSEPSTNETEQTSIPGRFSKTISGEGNQKTDWFQPPECATRVSFEFDTSPDAPVFIRALSTEDEEYSSTMMHESTGSALLKLENQKTRLQIEHALGVNWSISLNELSSEDNESPPVTVTEDYDQLLGPFELESQKDIMFSESSDSNARSTITAYDYTGSILNIGCVADEADSCNFSIGPSPGVFLEVSSYSSSWNLQIS